MATRDSKEVKLGDQHDLRKNVIRCLLSRWKRAGSKGVAMERRLASSFCPSSGERCCGPEKGTPARKGSDEIRERINERDPGAAKSPRKGCVSILMEMWRLGGGKKKRGFVLNGQGRRRSWV